MVITTQLEFQHGHNENDGRNGSFGVIPLYFRSKIANFRPMLKKTNNYKIFYQELPMKHSKINFNYISQVVLKFCHKVAVLQLLRTHLYNFS